MKLSFLALASVLLLPALVHADIPPPPGFDEPCTLEKQVKPGLSCRACRASFRDAAGHCAKEVGEGYARACKSLGASVWTEVWCRSFGNPLFDAGVGVGDAGADAGPVALAPSGDASDEEAGTAALASEAEAEGRAEGGGCSALGGAPPLSALLGLAGLLVLRLRRRGVR